MKCQECDVDVLVPAGARSVLCRDCVKKRDRGAFESETIHRMSVEVARYWVIDHYLRTNELPKREVLHAYANGPVGFDWGNPPGDVDPKYTPLRGKRVVITYEVKDESEFNGQLDTVEEMQRKYSELVSVAARVVWHHDNGTLSSSGDSLTIDRLRLLTSCER